MKRILFVAEDLFPLGPSQSLIGQIHDLAAEGVDVHLGLLRPLAADLSSAIPATVHRLSDVTARSDAGYRRLDSTLLSLIFNRRNFSAIFGIRKLIKQLQPDRVHAWGTPVSMITLAAAQGLSAARLPELVCTELFARSPSGDGKAGSFCFRQKFAKAFVAGEMIGREIESLGCAEKIEVIPNRIQCDSSLFPRLDRKDAVAMLRSELSLPVDAKIAVAAAPLIARTRIKDLIWATDLLTVIRNDFHFVVFGSGEQYVDLRRFSELTEAGQNVHFLGRPPNAWALFQGCDLYWHSHLLEPSPLNMINAMSLGIPVVSVLGEATASLIKHQSTGFGTSFGARDEFGRWTKYVLEQTEQAELLSDQAKRFVESGFCY